jgi:hypothetical protein
MAEAPVKNRRMGTGPALLLEPQFSGSVRHRGGTTVKMLAIAILATVALVSATTVAPADPPIGCAPTVEAANGTEVACAQGEPEETEEAEEAEEAEEQEYEEAAAAAERSNLTASSAAGEPASTSARTLPPPRPPTPKLTSCRRASETTIRAEAKHMRKLRGKRRRRAERRLDRALCRLAV